jgi:hypothetical protein
MAAVESSMMDIGAVARAIALLEKLGVDQSHIQAVIDNPTQRRKVADALTGQISRPLLSQAEWINREMSIFSRLYALGFGPITRQRIDAAYHESNTVDHRFIPGGLTLNDLLDLWGKVGLKIQSRGGGITNPNNYQYLEPLPTVEGVVEARFEGFMRVTDDKYRPFMSSRKDQLAWIHEQGGDGFPSMEEHLYVLLRFFLEEGYIPFHSGYCSCRNKGMVTEASNTFMGYVGWVFTQALPFRQIITLVIQVATGTMAPGRINSEPLNRRTIVGLVPCAPAFSLIKNMPLVNEGQDMAQKLLEHR